MSDKRRLCEAVMGSFKKSMKSSAHVRLKLRHPKLAISGVLGGSHEPMALTVDECENVRYQLKSRSFSALGQSWIFNLVRKCLKLEDRFSLFALFRRLKLSISSLLSSQVFTWQHTECSSRNPHQPCLLKRAQSLAVRIVASRTFLQG